MNTNKILFVWENTYMRDIELNKRKNAFESKYGAESIYDFDQDSMDPEVLQNALLGWGFFATKSLVILRWLPRQANAGRSLWAEVASRLDNIEARLTSHRDDIPADHILVLVSTKPDKRLAGYKFYKKNCGDIKEFKPLDGRNAPSFIKSLIPSATHDQAKRIYSMVGGDAYTLDNECKKLNHYMEAHGYTKLEDIYISDVVYDHNLTDNFALLDNLIVNPSKSIELIDEAKQSGEVIYQYIGMVYRWLKIIIGMTDLYISWQTDGKVIAKTLKVHPFAVAKQIKKIKSFVASREHLRDMYTRLLDLDYGIKTGKYAADTGWLSLKMIVG